MVEAGVNSDVASVVETNSYLVYKTFTVKYTMFNSKLFVAGTDFSFNDNSRRRIDSSLNHSLFTSAFILT